MDWQRRRAQTCQSITSFAPLGSAAPRRGDASLSESTIYAQRAERHPILQYMPKGPSLSFGSFRRLPLSGTQSRTKGERSSSPLGFQKKKPTTTTCFSSPKDSEGPLAFAPTGGQRSGPLGIYCVPLCFAQRASRFVPLCFRRSRRRERDESKLSPLRGPQYMPKGLKAKGLSVPKDSEGPLASLRPLWGA